MNDAGRASAWVRTMPVIFVLIWSTGFIVARYGMPYAPPLKFLSIRYALSFAGFLVWIVAARVGGPVGLAQYGHLAMTGVLMQAGYLGGVWAAVHAGMGAGLSALIVGLQPVLTALWTTATGGAAVHRRQWLGLLLGLAGLVLVVWNKVAQTHEVHGLSLALAVVALFSITAGTLYQKRFVRPCDVRSASAVQQLVALAVTLPFAAFEVQPVEWTAESMLAMGWSVLALTLGGSSLLYLLIQRGSATTVASLMYLVPPCTAGFAWLLFREPLSALTLAGIAITAVGVSLVVRAPTPAR